MGLRFERLGGGARALEGALLGNTEREGGHQQRQELLVEVSSICI